jgi:hypothetical protein
LLPRKGVLWLAVKPYINGACCPHRGRRGKLVKRSCKQVARVSRSWRDLPVGGLATAITYNPREIICETHGRVREDIPWAAKHSRTTLRFIILKNKKNRTRREHKVMVELARPQRQVARACELKDELSHF